MPNEFQDDDPELHQLHGEGKYANYFQVGHNMLEFILDFGQSFSAGRTKHFHTRIVMSPSYARELLSVLEESVAQYESIFGPIPNK